MIFIRDAYPGYSYYLSYYLSHIFVIIAYNWLGFQITELFTVWFKVIQCFDIISSLSRDHMLGNLNFIPLCFCSFFFYFLNVYIYGNKCYYLLCEIHPSCTINFLCYNNNAIVTQRKLCWVPPFLHTKEYKHPLKYLSR